MKADDIYVDCDIDILNNELKWIKIYVLLYIYLLILIDLKLLIRWIINAHIISASSFYFYNFKFYLYILFKYRKLYQS